MPIADTQVRLGLSNCRSVSAARREWRDLSDRFFTPQRQTLQTFGIGTYFGTLSDKAG
jgi:hypothetical protein